MVDSRTTFHTMIALVVGFTFTAISIIVAKALNVLPNLNLLEVATVATGYSCTYLCVFQVRWQYLFAGVSTILLVVFFWQAGLYGSALANAYLPIALVYGWFRWGNDEDTRPVTWVDHTMWPWYIILALGGWALTFYGAQAIGIHIPPLDGGILALTILAQFLMDNKKMECWIVWAILNVIAIKLYFEQELILAGIQYILFLGNAVFAFIMWGKSRYVSTKVSVAEYEPIENMTT